METILWILGGIYGAGFLLMFLYCSVLMFQDGAENFGSNFGIATKASLLWFYYLPAMLRQK